MPRLTIPPVPIRRDRAGGELAILQAQDPPAGMSDEGGIACRDQNGRAEPVHALEDARQQQRGGFIDIAGRFVGDQEFGPSDDGAGDRDKLPLAARQHRSRPVDPLLQAQPASNSGLPADSRSAVPAMGNGSATLSAMLRSSTIRRSWTLFLCGGAAPPGRPGRPARIRAGQHQSAAGRPFGERDNSQQRRLAGAAAAGQHMEPAGVQRQRSSERIGARRHTACRLLSLATAASAGEASSALQRRPIRGAAFRAQAQKCSTQGRSSISPGPGAACADDAVADRPSDRIRVEQCSRGPFPARTVTGPADPASITTWPTWILCAGFAREALRQAAQGELPIANGGRARVALDAGAGAVEQVRAAPWRRQLCDLRPPAAPPESPATNSETRITLSTRLPDQARRSVRGPDPLTLGGMRAAALTIRRRPAANKRLHIVRVSRIARNGPGTGLPARAPASLLHVTPPQDDQHAVTGTAARPATH